MTVDTTAGHDSRSNSRPMFSVPKNVESFNAIVVDYMI